MRSHGTRTPVPLKEAIEDVERRVNARVEQIQEQEEKRRQEQEANRLRVEQEQKELDDMNAYIRCLFG